MAAGGGDSLRRIAEQGVRRLAHRSHGAGDRAWRDSGATGSTSSSEESLRLDETTNAGPGGAVARATGAHLDEQRHRWLRAGPDRCRHATTSCRPPAIWPGHHRLAGSPTARRRCGGRPGAGAVGAGAAVRDRPWRAAGEVAGRWGDGPSARQGRAWRRRWTWSMAWWRPGSHRRTWVHAGPVLFRRGDYFGQAVNVASRIAECASPGEVLVTREVVEAPGEDGVTFTEIGPVELKGIAGPVHRWPLAGQADGRGCRASAQAWSGTGSLTTAGPADRLAAAIGHRDRLCARPGGPIGGNHPRM